MIEPLPKWLMQRYSLLWVKFKDKEFNHEQATQTLPDDERMVSVILSEMRKAGWLEMRLDPSDARKRLYKLKAPDEVVKEIAKGEK
jgi:hypothetical protein